VTEEPKGRAIITKGVKLPEASAVVIDRMARSGVIAVEEYLHVLDDTYEVMLWEELNEEDRDCNLVRARAMYTSLACQAGAFVKTIEEPAS
jgi:hypothetical protein